MDLLFLAQQSSQSGSGIGRVVVLLAVLLGVVAAGIVAAVWYRRRYLRSQSMGSDEMRTLDGLREMRKRGDISEEEFQRVRRHLIGAMSATMLKRQQTPDSDPPDSNPPGGGKTDGKM